MTVQLHFASGGTYFTTIREKGGNCLIMYKPALYANANSLQRRDAKEFSDEFSDEIGKMSGRCIDIGSGPGDVVADFFLPKLTTDATIVCSDISQTMVNFAREKYVDNRRMSFVQLDIESPDIPGDLVQQFDHVTSFYCVHWCQDIRQVFENIFNLLRPGGSALLSFIAKSPILTPYKTLAAMPRYRPYMQDADRYIPVFQYADRPRETLKTLLQEIGFEVQHCSIREKSWIFNTPEVLLKFMLALNPFIQRMPNDVKEEYKKDLVKEAAKQNIILNQNEKNEDQYRVLLIHHPFILYLKKPMTT